jgi:hypothetical protein
MPHLDSWLLSPRRVEAAEPLTRIDKESNRLAETPLPADLDEEAFLEYPQRKRCPGCGVVVASRAEMVLGCLPEAF